MATMITDEDTTCGIGDQSSVYLPRSKTAREIMDISCYLQSSDTTPSKAKSAKEEGCSIPSTPRDIQLSERLHSLILRTAKNDDYNAECKLLEFLNFNPKTTRLFVSKLNAKKKKKGSTAAAADAKRKGNKKQVSQKYSDPRPEDYCLCKLPIHVTASIGNTTATECILLVDKNCTIIGDSNGMTALHHATRNGKLSTVQLICAYTSVSAQILDNNENLPLHYAVGSASLWDHSSQIMTTLLATYLEGMRVKDKNGFYPLHLAAKYGFVAGIRLLLECDVDLMYERANGMLPLDYAIHGHYLSCQMENSKEQNKSSFPNMNQMDETIQKEQIVVHASHRKKDFEQCISILLMSLLHRRAILMQPNNNGDGCPPFLPFHAAVYAHLHPSSWDHLLHMYGRKHIFDLDHRDRTVMHHLVLSADSYDCMDGNNFKTMVRQIYELDSLIMRRIDCWGCLPLHLAVLENKSMDVIKALLDCDKITARARWETPSIPHPGNR